MKQLEEFLAPTQKELFSKLVAQFKGAIVRRGSYILVPGKAPVLLVAHLDTVHHESVKTICKSDNGNILMSPEGIGGDDRCGVYALVTAHERAEVKPWLLFTCDEEVGGVGASAFCAEYEKGKLPKGLKELKAIIEIDRKGRNDAVYYDCANTEFEDYISRKGFHTEFGSFSDISYVAPVLGVAAVNLSSGYYNAHTQHEYINRKHLNTTIRKVELIIADAVKPGFPKYEYVESVRFTRGGSGLYGGWGRNNWWDDEWGQYSSRSTTIPTTKQTGKKEPEPECGLLTCGDDFDIDSIPAEIREQYFALLDFYSVEELEEVRAENGDQSILLLAESEFGDDYYGMFGEDEDYED